ncbi:Na/Pi cotransporter family protein [Azoarcus sp. DD4]|uniref:Na/Pi cotransporter family protein n=1 Tax=Azoarcus sp. DD4 TaxID=2027405 RepID=UPI003529E329
MFSLFDAAGGFFGGVGLFLLGMHLLTDGLKLAAGRALEDLLERSTSTRLRGLAAGILITSLVQSSTAVTVASIGFVNTGLLSLQNALWVIFGSNVGTTMNAWLVAALGFGFRIDAFALPFVGLGAVLMLASGTPRLRALGEALAGFGVLFLGIDVLKESFSGIGGRLDLAEHIRPGFSGYLILVAIGTLLTVLMQASGAVIAIVITAAQGGLMSIEAACALVIGTNIGTTFTAILSAVGATSNARRLAAAHVFFNLVTGAVALVLLPVLIGLLGVLRTWFGQPATPAVMIALFHSVFNVLGVLLMAVAANWLLAWLGRHFRTREEELGKPQFLDAGTASMPYLALRALRMELGRTQTLATECLLAVSAPNADEAGVIRRDQVLSPLARAISTYAERLNVQVVPPGLSDRLARSLRVLQYQQTVVECCRLGVALGTRLGAMQATHLADAAYAFTVSIDALAHAADCSQAGFTAAGVEAALAAAEADYLHLKESLLTAGAHAQMSIRDMQDRLRHASLLRRAAEQAAKAARHLSALDEGEATPPDLPGADFEPLPAA